MSGKSQTISIAFSATGCWFILAGTRTFLSIYFFILWSIQGSGIGTQTRDSALKAAGWLLKWTTVVIVDRSCILFPDVTDNPGPVVALQGKTCLFWSFFLSYALVSNTADKTVHILCTACSSASHWFTNAGPVPVCRATREQCLVLLELLPYVTN